ncbi:MAG: F0F1 ATP synthase subunit B' [Acidisphaera sp.]|nr:F0F1 ATP synthase subunit B' [Acidisphaera sp.]
MRRLALAAFALSLALPVAARAAEGMPQLAFDNPLTLSQIVWMALIFFGLYWLISTWALPQVTSVLEAREARINADLEAAREAKHEADGALKHLTEATQKARSEANAAITQAADEAKKRAAEQSETLNARLEEQLRDAEQRIGQARKEAMGALRQVATDTATALLARLTGHDPEARTVEGAVGAALDARGRG